MFKNYFLSRPASSGLLEIGFATILLGTMFTVPALAQTVTVAAAGDIACSPDSDDHFDGGAGDANHCQMAATADLIAKRNVDAVLAIGDIQYSTGRLAAYQGSYDATWGSLKDKTYPVPGNHDYNTDGATGYYKYFGERAGDPSKGYYSYDLGAWHVVALNSNCDEVKGCSADSKQGKWLKADLAAHPSACILAYWHHPRFSSGYHGSNAAYQDFWDSLVPGWGRHRPGRPRPRL